ncbi:MAG: hypothetical protein WB676_02775 [Bryobacteraceae bacterium]
MRTSMVRNRRRWWMGWIPLAAFLLFPRNTTAREHWSELNIGPFRVDYDRDQAKARQVLANLEQVRWIVGGMLETKDLEATWPFRVLVTEQAQGASATVRLAHAQYIAAIQPGDEAPLAEVARILLEANTARLPQQVDSTLPLLFSGLEAHGTKVTWAKRPAHPDLNWARIHLFATKTEYSARFSVFINDLRGGALLEVAEANAFGHDSKTLEQEAAAHLDSGSADAVTISARPLDPKRDFGEHPLDSPLAELYLADTKLKTDSRFADQAYKAAGTAGYQSLAQEGFALLVVEGGGDPREYLDGAIAAGSKSAWVYAKAAENRPAAEATGFLKTARELNPKWWLPPAKLAELASKPAEKEALFLEACNKNPRSSALWQSLAEVQSGEGKGIAAQNSWIRAEDAAATPDERERVQKRRQDLENQRLDAEEKAKKDAQEAAHAEDERLQADQTARIRAAEQRANTANGGSSGSAENKDVLPWWNAGEHPLEASLVRVDCLDQRARLWVKPGKGKTMALLVSDPSRVAIDGTKTALGCGIQQPPPKITLTYKSRLDKELGTSGDVVAIHFE